MYDDNNTVFSDQIPDGELQDDNGQFSHSTPRAETPELAEITVVTS